MLFDPVRLPRKGRGEAGHVDAVGQSTASGEFRRIGTVDEHQPDPTAGRDGTQLRKRQVVAIRSSGWFEGDFRQGRDVGELPVLVARGGEAEFREAAERRLANAME